MKYQKIILCICLCFINHATQSFFQNLWNNLTRTYEQDDNNQPAQDESSECNQTLTTERAQFFAKILHGNHMNDAIPSNIIPKDYKLPDGTSPIQFAIECKNTHAIVNLVNAGYRCTVQDYESAQLQYHRNITCSKNPFTFLKNKSQQLYNWTIGYFLRRNIDPNLLITKGNLIIDFNSPQAQLTKAAETNNIPLLQQMLAQGAHPNARFLGSEALELAIFHGNKQAVHELLADKRTIATPWHITKAECKIAILETELNDNDDYPGTRISPDKATCLSYDRKLYREIIVLLYQKIYQQQFSPARTTSAATTNSQSINTDPPIIVAPTTTSHPSTTTAAAAASSSQQQSASAEVERIRAKLRKLNEQESK